MANYIISEMRKDLVAIHEDSRKAFVSRNEVLDTLEKFSGSYEALVKFAQECTPVDEGEFEDWEYALDMIAPEVGRDGVLSFEIPYSVYVWNAKGQTWDNQDDVSDEDEEGDDEVPVSG